MKKKLIENKQKMIRMHQNQELIKISEICLKNDYVNK